MGKSAWVLWTLNDRRARKLTKHKIEVQMDCKDMSKEKMKATEMIR